MCAAEAHRAASAASTAAVRNKKRDKSDWDTDDNDGAAGGWEEGGRERSCEGRARERVGSGWEQERGEGEEGG